MERRAELAKIALENRYQRPSVRRCSHVDSFIKLEAYPEFKEARWINSRHDAFKAYSGRFFSAIEEELYKNPAFIKHVPIPKRPALIKAMIHRGLRYYENDFKAFESHFEPKFMRVCEGQLYKHVLSRYPDDADFIVKVITGRNKLHTSVGIGCTVMGRRMSGDMCTSLGNGFTNLMLFKYICHLHGGSGEGFVEGDDGIFATNFEMKADDYKKLGFTVEIKELDNPCHGHFCGMTFTETGEIIKDPRKVFATFGWTSSYIHAGNAIMDELLRSKALSLAYELPQCPIVGVLSRVALELTDGIIPGHHESKWGRDMHSVLHTPVADFAPSNQVRELFAELFDISVETQLAAEQCIREHDMASLALLVPPHPHVALYAARYVELGSAP